MDAIHSTFLPHEVEIILGIPLSSLPTKDRLVWPTTSNGAFAICSAYHVAKKLLDQAKFETLPSGPARTSFQQRLHLETATSRLRSTVICVKR